MKEFYRLLMQDTFYSDEFSKKEKLIYGVFGPVVFSLAILAASGIIEYLFGE